MKRFNLAIVCAGTVGALVLAQMVLAQAQQASKDLATLIQSGQTKQALEQIRAGADVNKAQAEIGRAHV